MSRNKIEPIDSEMLVPAIGAMIYASDEPVPPKEIAGALGGVSIDDVERAVEELTQVLSGAGIGLGVERVAGGYRLATRSDVGPWVRRFFQQRNRTRLSPAALETLAIVAYRQPVTAPEIQAIRGKDPSASLKNLVDKKMLRILGKKKVVGSPLLYGTRKQFLVHFGLDGLSDLPSVEDFDEFLGALDSEQGDLFRGGGEGETVEATGLEGAESGESVVVAVADHPVEESSENPAAVEAEELDMLSRIPESEESH